MANPGLNDPTTGTVVRVGEGTSMTWTPMHTVFGPLPVGTNGVTYRASLTAQNPGNAVNADTELCGFRFVTSRRRVAFVSAVLMSIGMDMSLATASNGVFSLYRCVKWTTDLSGGIDLSDPNQRLRTSHTANSETQLKASTGAIAGTKTVVPTAIGSAPFGLTTAAATVGPTLTMMPRMSLLGDPMLAIAYPLMLEHQEGFVIKNSVAISRPLHLYQYDIQWTEVDYDF